MRPRSLWGASADRANAAVCTALKVTATAAGADPATRLLCLSALGAIGGRWNRSFLEQRLTESAHHDEVPWLAWSLGRHARLGARAPRASDDPHALCAVIEGDASANRRRSAALALGDLAPRDVAVLDELAASLEATSMASFLSDGRCGILDVR